ncbi:MAG: dihydroxyacetone kinase subunit DhaL, partial [Methylococcales bacterium]
MPITPAQLPQLLQTIAQVIDKNAEQITELDQAIGDGDHVTNLQRGLQALLAQSNELSQLDWLAAWQKIGMILMSAVGGASGSLYATLFLGLSKAGKDKTLDLQNFADIFSQAIDAVKQRGKAEAGEKTMLDVYIPVATCLQSAAKQGLPMAELSAQLSSTAIAGMEATRDMQATKGRASFLGERSIGHIDAGAKTAQLIICA